MALLRRALLLGAFLTAGCYSPAQPSCAFSCVANGVCPDGFRCGADGLCHRNDGQGTCNIPSQVDGGTAAADALAE
jgi:hypothetical protein